MPDYVVMIIALVAFSILATVRAYLVGYKHGFDAASNPEEEGE